MTKLEREYGIDYESKAAKKDGLGFFRVLLVVFAVVVLAALQWLATGCASIDTQAAIEQLDKLADKWKDKLESVPAAPTQPQQPTQQTESTPDDAIAFSELSWTYGAFNGGGSRLDVPRVSNLSVQRNGMSIRWEIDLRSWGLSHGDPGALACLFCKVDGVWRGGKFDWISSSRSTRDFKNIHDGYGGWSVSDFERAEAYAFVVVSADGKRRGNVTMCEVK